MVSGDGGVYERGCGGGILIINREEILECSIIKV